MAATDLRPNLYLSSDRNPVLRIIRTSSATLTPQIIDRFLSVAVVGGVVGVAVSFGKHYTLKALALAADDQVLAISLSKSGPGKQAKNKFKAPPPVLQEALREKILVNRDLDKLGFDMEKIATALYMDCAARIAPAIDAQSMHSETKPRYSDAVLLGIMGGEAGLRKDNVLRVLRNDDKTGAEEVDVVIRAWASWSISTLPAFAKRRPAAKTICTDMLLTTDLAMLSRCIYDGGRLFAMKPTKVRNDCKGDFKLDKSGNVQLDLERYKTRVRASNSQRILVETTRSGTGARPLIGHAKAVKGKVATVKLAGGKPLGKITSVHTIGKEFTNAEQERISIVLAVLHRTSTFLTHPLVRRIYFTPGKAQLDGDMPREVSAPIYYDNRPLNTSQSLAVKKVLSGDPKDRIVLIQGPPGTGKTTVIAACVKSLMTNPNYKEVRHIWLLAQSNVAVKNIAEKLAEVNFFDFKLVVSNEFHFEWHEHLYKKIEQNVIVSDVFSESSVAFDRLLLGSRVILCTMSMLSHPRLMQTGLTRLVPLETILVDEASQIEIGDYLPMLNKFANNIRKIAFIGDDKQLAPYGAEDILGLRSIFEVPHLRKRAEWLGKQCTLSNRMPAPVGHFISRRVYGGRLGTQHTISERSCCRFVDVHKGKEVKSNGSYVNMEEVQAVVHVVRRFAQEGKSFRVITPYDAQRGKLEQQLKAAELPWENKCFCVDSFQGNEDDHIVISVVRSDKIGFLSNLRRSNVMLSRCKASMTICTSKRYLSGIASKTLLGEMAGEWGSDAWVTWSDLLSRRW
ncbi:P-loop containing nucleoside triphosphate hydrolase protein [Cristinia sonorae]|uniref:P-loop containing nucleoside triphosphate hydrolase protein n=1 Tax=Cristinia sonorae TaxID=1940300 RepID=A0A8K0UPJ3_9AGAR|nr:P-loop containing nucleoside triphosphate hydrolase protein [Cristinia sonorae]